MIPEYACVFMAMMCYLGYICAAVGFCKKYLEISRIGEILFVTLNVSGRTLINIWGRFYFGWYGILVSLDHFFFMGLILLLFRGMRGKKILAASSLIAVHTLTGNFSGAFLSCLVLFWKHTMQNVAEPFLGNWESCLISGVSLIMVILAVKWSGKHFWAVFHCVTGKGDIVLAIPLLAAAAVTDAANWGAGYGILVRSGGNMGVYYDQIFSHAGFCVLAALSMFAVGGYFFGMEHVWLEQEKSRQYRSQIAAFEMLEEQYRRSERLRHDLKNHVIVLTGLLEKKEWKKMGSYLDNMADSADLRTGEEITGNRVVDILLYQKRKSAEEKGIIWECDVQMPKNCCIDEFDLCVLFGNILDNAVEACERLERGKRHCDRLPFIRVQAGSVKKCFLLEVKNSVSMAERNQAKLADQTGTADQIERTDQTVSAGPIEAADQIELADQIKLTDRTDSVNQIRPVNGITGKKDQERHGIGLLNVRDVVHKYNGVMNTEVWEDVFVTSVLVPLRDPDITSDVSFETGI